MSEIEEKAIAKFYEYSKGIKEACGGLVIVPEATVEEEDLLILSYTTKDFLLKGRAECQLIGAGGILVEKATLNLYHTGTPFSAEYYMSLFRTDKSSFEKVAPNRPE